MIRLNQIKLPIDHTENQLYEKIEKILKVKKEQILSYQIVRRSVDARKKPQLFFVYTLNIKTPNDQKILSRLGKGNNNNVMLTKETLYTLPSHGDHPLKERPVIVGSGPAGLFCAWLLAKEGYQPIVLERGSQAEKRKKQVTQFWNGGSLDTQSNVQFGEGGAGTFSDGKLNTTVKDPQGRNHKVLELFVHAGAPAAILYDHKPHLGTDQLIQIVVSLRKEIESMGGEFLFETCLTDLEIEGQQIRKIQINHSQWIPTQILVLAIGHSARDTFQMLYEKKLAMESKPFAVGVRIEHPQSMINESQYGLPQVPILGSANYKVTHQLSNHRGIYSFCMCPGGYVVNASSEEGYLAVNGMSYQARNSENANSAMIVTVTPQDYYPYALEHLKEIQGLESARIEESNPLTGIWFQRNLERKAFLAGNGKIPIQTFHDFQKGVPTAHLGNVNPCMKGAWEMTNLCEVFPDFITESLREGISACGKKIHGFDRGDSILSGVESRTSSPVRILRDENCMSGIKGIYPCGEGAGYAGGITSAAMDGLKVAEAICKEYLNFHG